MALVNVNNIAVLNNPTGFQNPFSFEITFECLQELEDDLEWKVLYVGKAADCNSDLVLDEVLVGPVPVGINKFILEADPPAQKALGDELLGVTVVLVTCSYREREFVRVGYYVNNMMEGYDPNDDDEDNNNESENEDGNDENNTATANSEQPKQPQEKQQQPMDEDESATVLKNNDEEVKEKSKKKKKKKIVIEISKVTRQILADKPRVTKFPIPWGDNDNTADTTTTNNNEDGDPQTIPNDEEDEKIIGGDDEMEEEEEEEEPEPEGEEAEDDDEDDNDEMDVDDGGTMTAE